MDKALRLTAWNRIMRFNKIEELVLSIWQTKMHIIWCKWANKILIYIYTLMHVSYKMRFGQVSKIYYLKVSLTVNHSLIFSDTFQNPVIPPKWNNKNPLYMTKTWIIKQKISNLVRWIHRFNFKFFFTLRSFTLCISPLFFQIFLKRQPKNVSELKK